MFDSKFEDAKLSDSKVISNMPDFNTFLEEGESYIELEQNLSCLYKIEKVLETCDLSKSTVSYCKDLILQHKLGNILTKKQRNTIDNIVDIQTINTLKQEIWQQYKQKEITLNDIFKLEPEKNNIPSYIAISDAKAWAKIKLESQL